MNDKELVNKIDLMRESIKSIADDYYKYNGACIEVWIPDNIPSKLRDQMKSPFPEDAELIISARFDVDSNKLILTELRINFNHMPF